MEGEKILLFVFSRETNIKEVFPDAIDGETNVDVVEESDCNENCNKEVLLKEVESEVQNNENIELSIPTIEQNEQGHLTKKVIVIETHNFEETNKDDEFIILDACHESFDENIEDFVIVENVTVDNEFEQARPTHFIQVI